jgi:RecJ-like exonuclease
MKRTIQTLCAVLAVSAIGAAAQTSQTETKTTVEVKSGESVNVTGCVQPMAGGHGFLLTHVADKKGAMHNYILVSDEGDLAKHVGHRVQIDGKVTDGKDGKVKVETETKTKVEGGDDHETKRKAEVEGAPYLGVRSIKMIAAACP